MRMALALLFAGLISSFSRADNLQHYTLSLLVTEETSQYQEAAKKIQERFADVSVFSTWPTTRSTRPRLVLTLGPRALRMALERSAANDVVVSLFSSRENFFKHAIRLQRRVN